MSAKKKPQEVTLVGNSFEWALAQLKLGKAISRISWTDNKWFLRLRRPTNTSELQSAYIYMDHFGKTVPWVPQQWDIMAEDYVLYA